MTDERALIGHAQAGNAAAFAQLFAAYHGPITSYLYHLVRDRAVADDLAQDTFLQAYRMLQRTTPDLHFRAWLYRIATNAARNYQRRQRLLRWLPFAPGLAGPGAGPHDEPPLAERVADRELVALTLRRIRPGYASALLLHHHQDLTLEETAAALGLTPNGAKVRLFRARKAFVRAYGELLGEREA